MDIAIIGIAGKFPMADDMEALYHLLAAGKDCVREISADRKSRTALPFDKDYIETAYLEEIDLFDPKYFGISKAEAAKMAPQQRLALEVVHQALDNSGYSLDHFSNSRTAIYAGDTQIAYDRHITPPLDPTEIMGTTSPFLVGRVARVFNLRGAAAMIDTTCSSSLVALHTAINDLKCGDSDYAIVLGVNLEEFPLEKSAYAFSEEMGANILSSAFRAKTFSAAADGTGVGEAVVCVLLKPLEAALRDRDFIHAVIKGSAVNQDAALSASLTAPDPEAQAEVILAAWKKSGVNPANITFIEAHGTGTTLGDPIEIDGIKRAFRAFTDKAHFCSVSAIKTNLGHTDSAAGLAGLAKVVLSLRHKVLFPNVHFDKPNPLIDFDKGPLYVQTGLAPWQNHSTEPRTAGLSAFGLIGTNCHVVVQEAPGRPEKADKPADKNLLLAVSAKTHTSLRLNLAAISAFIAGNNDVDLEDIAYTLLCGRNHYEKRAAVVANHSNAVEKLNGLLAGPEREILPAKFILVFSDHHSFPLWWLNHAPENIPGFEDCLEKIRPQLPVQFNADEKISAFVFQYCFYQLLHVAGLHFDALVGDGIGKQVIAVIKGVSTISEAIATIQAGLTPSENLLQRIENLITREQQDKELVLLEMGPAGNLSALISQIETARGCRLVTLQETETPAFETYLQNLYLAGQQLNWPLFFAGTAARKIPLPAYQFDRQRYWIKAPTEPIAKPAAELPVTFYNLQLTPAAIPPATEGQARKLGIVLEDSGQYRDRIPGAFPDDQLYFISGNMPEQRFRERVIELTRDHGVEAFLEFNFLDTEGLANFEKPDLTPLTAQWQRWKVYAEGEWPVHVFTARAIAAAGEMQDTFGAGSLALFKAVVTDTGRKDFTFTDIDPEDTASWAILGSTARATLPFQVTALRRGNLFQESLLPCDTPKHAGYQPHPLKNGAYLITGGARGIGHEISKFIASNIESGTLILIGKTGLDERDTAGDAFSVQQRNENINRLRTLNERVQVVYFQLDLTDRNAVLAAMETIRTTYGQLQLIVHGAGEGSRGIHFSAETGTTISQVLGPKIAGTLHLYEALQGLVFQKLILFSSLNAVWPQKGSTFYAVANAFLDAFAFRDPRIQSVRWPGWNSVGMSAAEPPTALSLYPEEGIAVFNAIMGMADTVISPVKGNIDFFGHNPFFKIESGKKGPDTTLSKAAPAPALRPFILDLWKKALHEPDISADDNFFEIGGHSLLGTQIVNTLNEALGIDLFFEDLYDYSTVNDLAAYIETLNKEVAPSQPKASEQAAIPANRIPLAPAQHGVWVAHTLSEAHGNFNIPGLIELSGELDGQALEAALRGVISRHETLRTRFETVGNEIFQYVVPVESVDFVLETQDFSALNVVDVQAHARTASRQFATQPVLLEKEFPFKARLLKYGAGTHVLALVLHHIVGDGVSIDIFIRELFENYEEYRTTGVIAHKPLSVKYADYVLEMQAYTQSDDFADDRNWWVKQLKDNAPALALPYDYERPQLSNKAAGKVEVLFTKAESDLFHQIKNDLKVSSYVLFTALVKLLLFKYHGPGIITIGTPYFGRYKKDYESQIGLFVNLFVIRDTVAASMTFAELAEAVKKTYTEVLKHKRFPFEWLARETGALTEINRKPFYDVSINYWEDQQNIYGANTFHDINPRLKRRTFGYAEAFVHEDLSFELLGGKQLYANILFDQDLFQPVTIELMKERLLQLLRNLESGTNLPIARYDFSLGLERTQPGSAMDSMELQERF